VSQGRISIYELNPPFTMLYKGNPSGSDKVATYSVRNVSLVAGEEGFEPSLTDPESAVLPLDDSPACQNYIIRLNLKQ
jgi:hypothetical protein